MSAPTWIVFLIAAAIGAPARYLLDGWVQDRTRGAFPWGTFTVNVSGCFLLGVLTGLRPLPRPRRDHATVLGTGGLGAYTTFSTFTFETVRLAEEGAVDEAFRYAAASVIVGLAAAAAGIALTAF